MTTDSIKRKIFPKSLASNAFHWERDISLKHKNQLKGSGIGIYFWFLRKSVITSSKSFLVIVYTFLVQGIPLLTDEVSSNGIYFLFFPSLS